MAHTTSTKLVTLANLATYNHQLCAQLGLTQDTAGYAYAASSITNPAAYTKATNVKQALDQLYDLVGLGAGIKSVAPGKSTKTGDDLLSVAEFTREYNDTANDLYYIHITTADGKEQDIKLDATNFVKDSFLSGADTGLYVDPVNGTTKATKVEKGTAGAATYIELTMTCKGDADVAEHNEYIYVKTSDILGDLVAGDGIDITGSTISVKVDGATDANSVVLTFGANGVKVEVSSTTFAKGTDGDWTKDGDSVIADAASTLAAINGLQDQIDGLGAKNIEGKDAINITTKEDDATTQVVELKLDGSYLSQSENGLKAETGDVTYTASPAEGSKKWSAEANDLASTVEVAEVANELQDQIDAISAKNTTHVGGANVTAAPDGASAAANGAIYFTTTTEGNATTVTGGAIVATEDEIKGLFAVDA